MKIVHTSDWHLGHSLYGYNRDEEQASMLRQIEEIVRDEAPDALVVSGDIYHTGQPSAAVQKMFTEAVMRIHRSRPEMAVVVTAGNHDSASRHEISRMLWKTQNVYMIGHADKEHPDAQTVEIPGKGFIIAVPYLNDRKVPQGYYQDLLDRVAQRNRDGLPVVLSAHLTVSGSDFRGHDDARDYMVGGIDSIELDALGTGYDYAALGHIHHAQTLAGSGGRARYCGTPIPVSFDETYPHSVSVVEIAAHGERPLIRETAIRNPRPLVNIPADGFGSWEEVTALLKAFPQDNPAYIRLNVEVDGFLPPEAKAEALSILAPGEADLCYIHARKKCSETTGRKMMTVAEFRAMQPLEVAKRFAADSGADFSDEMEALFREVEQAVQEDKRNL